MLYRRHSRVCLRSCSYCCMRIRPSAPQPLCHPLPCNGSLVCAQLQCCGCCRGGTRRRARWRAPWPACSRKHLWTVEREGHHPCVRRPYPQPLLPDCQGVSEYVVRHAAITCSLRAHPSAGELPRRTFGCASQGSRFNVTSCVVSVLSSDERVHARLEPMRAGARDAELGLFAQARRHASVPPRSARS